MEKREKEDPKQHSVACVGIGGQFGSQFGGLRWNPLPNLLEGRYSWKNEELEGRQILAYRHKDRNSSHGHRTQQSAHHAYDRNHKNEVKPFVQRQSNRGAAIGQAQTFQRKWCIKVQRIWCHRIPGRVWRLILEGSTTRIYEQSILTIVMDVVGYL